MVHVYEAREVDFQMNIDEEFEHFVRKNYKKLTDAERKICEQLGVATQC